jgi:hypothetical protein
MKLTIFKRVGLSLGLFAMLLALPHCGSNEAKEQDTAAGEKIEKPIVLTTEEQRALKAEYSIQADKEISESNLAQTFENLKKEIEADL